MRVHGEPDRTPRACRSCGLPYDAAERAAIEARLPGQQYDWHFCPGCGEATCHHLKRLCAEAWEEVSRGR